MEDQQSQTKLSPNKKETETKRDWSNEEVRELITYRKRGGSLNNVAAKLLWHRKTERKSIKS